MKIVKVLFVFLSLFSLFSLFTQKEVSRQEHVSDCLICQKVVYQLKFDKMADCGTKPCKNTCHKIVHDWNAPNTIFGDFQNDVLGKCDICFRAGYCTLTECEKNKAEDLQVVNFIVENAIFRGKLDKENLKQYEIVNQDSHLTPSSITEMEKNVKKSLKNSMIAQNAEVAAKQIGDVVNTYVNNSSNNQNEKVLKRNVVYQNFLLQANIIAKTTDKEIEELKNLLEEYAKMKDFKTVSPVDNKKRNENDRTSMKIKMKALLKTVKFSVESNLRLVKHTLKNLESTHKKAVNYKQNILKRNQKTVSSQEKKHLDNLETEINALAELKKPLEEIKTNFENKVQTLKSFAFKLK
jgi:hypothetical protein